MLGFAGVEVSLAFSLVPMSLTLVYKVSTVVLPECVEIKISESQPSVAGMLDVDGDEDRDEHGDENTLSSGPYNLAVTTDETTPVVTESHVGAVSGFGIGEPYTGSQIPPLSPFLEQPNQTMGAMSASELLPDTLDLTMDHVPIDHDSTLDIVSLVGDSPATRSTSLIRLATPLNAAFNQKLDWWNSNMRSPSFNEDFEPRGKRILS